MWKLVALQREIEKWDEREGEDHKVVTHTTHVVQLHNCHSCSPAALAWLLLTTVP
jgi:hypothetical protein